MKSGPVNLKRVEPKDGVRGQFGPFLVDEAIVGTIVAALAKSADLDFLDEVMKVLAKSTPDSLVRNHDSVLESVLAHRKDLQWKGLLIGKLGRGDAELMGYMGTPKALNTLVADLLTPFTYAWNQMAQRSFRLHVIEALRQAYPFEPLLWPSYRQTSDAYYEEIENWAIKTLGINFSRPRPPFL